ncbi:hypothetical protein AcV5_009238 [Taiwanofungus camphoratus]|nr:hypothetical protein AcV5_009238 [Antrodia cinnamomea]
MFVYECVQTGLVSADAWTKLILGYSDIAEHFSKGYLWFTLPVMCTVLSATVQTYFAWRLWMLSMSRVIPAIISLLALAQMGAGFTAAADMKMHWPIPRYWEADLYNTSICVWLAGSALTDVIIAVSMTLTLSKAKTHYSRSSDCLVNRLVKIIVETGTLTASVAVVTLVLFSALPYTLLSECPMLILSNLFQQSRVRG